MDHRIKLGAILVVASAGAAHGQTAPTPAPVSIPQVNVVGSTPLLGSGIDRDQIPPQRTC